MHNWLPSALCALTMTSSSALAAPITGPFQALFSDQTTDQILFMADSNGDGDVNDAGEVSVFFDGANASGLVAPTRNVFTLIQSVTGAVYAGDGTTDTVYRLRDLNGDNTAQGTGEASVWFSADNAGGLPLQTANGLAEGGDGAIYVVQADTRGAPTQDVVYRTQDLNGDGDANDAGEASVWLDLSALNAGSSPFEITFNQDVAYIADTAGGSPRTYRAEDVNGDGKISADEVNEFLPSSAGLFVLNVETGGDDVYIYDFIGDALVRFTDLNGDKTIDMSTERFVAFDASGIVDGAVFDFAIKGTGALLTVNDFDGNDVILALSDLNGDGDFNDPGESDAVLEFASQGTYPKRPRSVLYYTSPIAAAPVPLPAGAPLLIGGLAALGLARRKQV